MLMFQRVLLTLSVGLIIGVNQANAADPIKRLLDLQLRKGIITQQEYDEFMQEMTQVDAPVPATPPAHQAKQTVQVLVSKELLVAEPAKPAASALKARLPYEKPTGNVSMGEPDTLKVDFFANIDVAVGYTSESLVESGSMPTSIGPWVTGGVKTPTTNPGAMSSQTGLFSNALSPSYWGVKASRNLDGEQLKAFIYLDSAINPASGQLTNQAQNVAANSKYATTSYATSALNGQLFSREAYIGIADASVGSLTLGRNNNLIQDVLGSYAPLQKASLFTPLGNGVLGGGGGMSENSRVDYSAKYRLNIDNWNLGVLYGFGGVGGLKHGAQGGAINLGYENPTFGIQLVVEEFSDLLKTSTDYNSTSNTIDLTAYDQRALMLVGKYNPTEKIHLQAGIQSMQLGAPKSDYNITKISSIYSQTVNSSVAYNGTHVNMNESHIGIDYDFTGKLNAGFAYVYIDMPSWSGFSNSPPTTTSFKGGNLSGTTLLVDYKFNKYTDWYAGALWTHYGGTAFATGYVRNIFTTATGLRFRF